MRRCLIVLLAAVLVGLATPATAARQTNGTNQCLKSSAALTLSGSPKLAVQLWLWWDAYALDDDFAMEYTTNAAASTGGFWLDPNASGGGGVFGFIHRGNGDVSGSSIPRPSAGAWHHYVFNWDMGLSPLSAELVSVYVDGVLQTTAGGEGTDSTGTWEDNTLALMSRNCTGLYGAGRIAEVALWSGVTLSQSEVDILYDGGSGTLATNVQNAALVHYWKLCGTAVPEPATKGTPTMTVTGATQVAHPITTCEAAPEEGTARRRRFLLQ